MCVQQRIFRVVKDPKQAHRLITVSIRKTYLYNFDPLKPHFYIVKLDLQGYKLFVLFLLKNIDCWYSLEPLCRGGSNEYPQSMFLSENFHILVIKFSVYLKRNVFIMHRPPEDTLDLLLLTDCPAKTDQTARMHMLIRVFARRICGLVEM